MWSRFTLVFFVTLSTLSSVEAQNESKRFITQNHIFSNNIRTVELYQKGWRLSYPYLQLNGNNQLNVDFDDLEAVYNTYYYTFIHCDADWNPSDLTVSDYLDGFPENQITDYKNSVNTTVPYIHYHFAFPDEDIHFKLSGNYIVIVYRDMDKEKPVLTARFMVYTSLVRINGRIVRPSGPNRDRDQQLDFSVNYSGYPVQSPRDELYIVVRQNNRWDNSLSGIKPSFERNQEFVYDYSSGVVFHGGNEFRDFDIKSIRYQSQHIRQIDYVPPYYNIRLKSSSFRTFDPYFFKKDLNGKFYIRNSPGNDPDNDADYVNVFFTLSAAFPLDSGDVYIFGALSGWHFSKSNRMTYNPDMHQYEGTMLLKQGFYNYAYAVKSPAARQGDLTRIEGSHFETENDYTVLVYHHSSALRYDRLIGLKIINSVVRK